jgi:excisionase family DNA binding protein
MNLVIDTEALAKTIALAVADELERRGAASASKQPVYNVDEAAQEMRVSSATIRRLVGAGRLRRVPGTGRVLIPADELARFQREGAGL